MPNGPVLPVGDPHGHRLVRDHEHPPAAADGRRRRHPPDRRPRLGPRSAPRSRASPGAIFGIPIAAVISALFFHWVARSRERGTVADRATQRVAAREGREVRRPREPVPGVDADVDEVIAAKVLQAHPRRPRRRSRGRRPDGTRPTAPAVRPRHERRASRGRAEPPTRRRPGPGPGDDPGARPLRAPRPGQGARRARRRARGASPARSSASGGRWAAGPAGRGSSSPTTTASSRAGCSRSSWRSTRSAT